MSTLKQVILDLLDIPGAQGAAVVDTASGMALATGGTTGPSLEVAAAGSANVIRAMLTTMGEIDLADEIEDMVTTLGTQYHLVRVMNADSTTGLFAYLVLDRREANLALARHKLRLACQQLAL